VHDILVGRPDLRKRLNGLGIDGSIILKQIFKKQDGDTRTDRPGSG
jgi:hypothetical protein